MCLLQYYTMTYLYSTKIWNCWFFFLYWISACHLLTLDLGSLHVIFLPWTLTFDLCILCTDLRNCCNRFIEACYSTFWSVRRHSCMTCDNSTNCIYVTNVRDVRLWHIYKVSAMNLCLTYDYLQRYHELLIYSKSLISCFFFFAFL
jgi:hypothetical protein